MGGKGRRVSIVVFRYGKHERRTRTEFELREGGVAVCRTLDPLWLMRLAVERLAFPRELAQLGKVPFLLALIL
jgi:hypothetical protein